MDNIKVHVPTEEISKLVQEKWFEKEFSWSMGCKDVQYISLPYLYIDCNRYITYSGDDTYFAKHEYQQVHYLQILADDYEGQLFRYNNDDSYLYYQDTKGFAHWYDRDRIYKSVEFSEGYNHYIKNNLITLLDINEQPIIIKEKTMNNNEMPELEAGKHLIEDEHGCYYLVLADGILVGVEIYDYGFKQGGWEIIDNVVPAKIYEIYRGSSGDTWSLLPISEGRYHTLIWSKEFAPTEREQLKSEYDGLCEQINILHKKAAELQEKL